MHPVTRQALDLMGVIDGHNDLPAELRCRAGYSVAGLDRPSPAYQTDLPRLRAGNVAAQFWSAWVPCHLTEPEAVVATLEQIDAIYRLIAAYPAHLRFARRAADVETAIAQGLIASLIGVEGGHQIARSAAVLRMYARLGVRYLTLTHARNTAWADSATDKPQVGGLTDEGRAVVAECERLGILVDLSHVAASTMRDALAVATVPVIFSHSSARAVTDHPRNVPDNVLAQLPTNGGVCMVTFVPDFVSQAYHDWQLEAEPILAAEGVRHQFGSSWAPAPRPGESPTAVMARWAAEQPGTPPSESGLAEPGQGGPSLAKSGRGVSDRDEPGPHQPGGDSTSPDLFDPDPAGPNTASTSPNAASTSPNAASGGDFARALARYQAAHPAPPVTVIDVADHVDHIRDLIGVDHIGLGGDYDGIPAQPQGLADVSTYPNLLDELARRGWSASDLAALTGRNILRVLHDTDPS
jgi:membrane dipeptidase